MRRPVKWLLAIYLMMTACNGNSRRPLQQLMDDRKSGLVQEKHIGNTVVRLTYLPECWERVNNKAAKADQTEMCFKINILRTGVNDSQKQENKAMSYGLDTIFQLILNHDTLSPLLAQRIANGNINGVEYLVIFERRPLSAVQQAALVYKDWLFTSTRLVFPLQKNYLQKSDSLSCRL
ncbi:hypothetical protein CLV51_1034 [Chitinophaga niastensis]|uniref:Uncharacterized protein n=1 Tax=Chitinophaga niastensis TaxID=536980 RepID=A0A2P8HIH9_CHINA|nr:hypothetical protein [Chitinophaga niastensis]PSL46028.1 hypothetical protein CLV51_1034 [Chitinophaga niastensis]